MNGDSSIQDIRDKRRKAWQVAQQIGDISRRTGVTPEEVSAQSLLTLPHWCLQDIDEIRALQRICGALYFAPTIYSSIDGSLLRQFRDFVSIDCFQYIRHSKKLFEHTVAEELSAYRLPVNVMAAGSSVLLSTLPEKKFEALYEQLIGPRSVALDKPLGAALYEDAKLLSARIQQNIRAQ